MRAFAVYVLLLASAALAQDVAPVLQQPVTIGQQLFSALLPILVMVVGGVATMALAALKKKWSADADATLLEKVGAKATDFAIVVVRDIEATLKAEIEKANADGIITPEEGRHLRGVALERMKAMMGERGLSELQAVMGLGVEGLEHYLGGLVETAVAKVSGPAPKPGQLVGPQVGERLSSPAAASVP